jgi:hypothetical protein
MSCFLSMGHQHLRFTQYLKSLNNRLKPQRAPAAGKSKSKNPPPMLLNLDAEDGEEEYILPDEDDAGGLTEKETQFRSMLTKKYSDCRRCGAETPCKINRLGLHSRLTFNQINAWAVALVCECLYPM